MKNQINNSLAELCRTGLSTGCYSGVSAALSVKIKGQLIRAFFSGGVTRKDSPACPVGTKTLFDLASLCKPLCTTLCVLDLFTQGIWSWEDDLDHLLAGQLPEEKRNIHLSHLLGHSSGLPAYKPYFMRFTPEFVPENKKRLMEMILAEPLISAPGTACLYSDLGFMVLGWLLEEQSGKRLDTLFKERITGPLQLTEDLCFLPFGSFNSKKIPTCAATEDCSWRKRILQGEVHDEHCWLMGGVAGHAGLFGTAAAVLTLCERILESWEGDTPLSHIGGQFLRHALENRHPAGSWCLGFDTPTPGASSSGRFFSQKSVGHLGFSGTSFWIDPANEMVVVLLTNRVHPTRENTKIRKFRPFFHDQLMKVVLAAGKGGSN